MKKFSLSDEQWREKLNEQQYRVMRQKGTEAPYSGEYVFTDKNGFYVCAGCGSQLFSSEHKYESKTPGLLGWPSFSEALPGAVEYKADNSLGMKRTEVVCATCASHLGHIFDDEASPNGTHYCINSVCLELQPKKDENA